MDPKVVSDILVFKTNLTEEHDVDSVARLLNADERVMEWNVDREDIDKVLRVRSGILEARDVISIVERSGYQCEELTD